jgi:hypothetical protein
LGSTPLEPPLLEETTPLEEPPLEDPPLEEPPLLVDEPSESTPPPQATVETAAARINPRRAERMKGSYAIRVPRARPMIPGVSRRRGVPDGAKP